MSDLREMLERATPRPWVKFHSRYGDNVVAIMKGKSPGYDDRGYLKRKWKEIIAWSGFDGADTSEPQRHHDAALIVAAVNILPTHLDQLAAKDARIAELEAGLRAIVAHFADRHQAPGHSHDVPGVWDADNPPGVAGTTCIWCAEWNAARALLAEKDTSHD